MGEGGWMTDKRTDWIDKKRADRYDWHVYVTKGGQTGGTKGLDRYVSVPHY